MTKKTMDLKAYAEVKNVMGDVLNELIETFIEYMPEQIENLNTAITNQEPENIFSIAHRIKSSSNSLGALGLAATAETIELIGRSGKSSGATEHIQRLNQQYAEVVDFLKQELKTL